MRNFLGHLKTPFLESTPLLIVTSIAQVKKEAQENEKTLPEMISFQQIIILPTINLTNDR